MKKIAALFLLLYILHSTFYIPVAEGHLVGQPPFFQVNGEYANLYPVPLTSLSGFPLPQDLTPGIYLVNQEIKFGLDIKRLPAPPDIVGKTQFSWDFGDGGTASGLSTSHTYTKIGSYILKITAFDGTTPTPQLLESALINVFPDQNYKLPKARIKIEGRESKDPLTDILQFPLGRSLHFDGTSSIAPSGKIVSYFWDFGDQKSSDKALDDHYYPGDLTQIFPILRIKDSNGFISDSFVEIQNQDQGLKTFTSKPTARPKVSSSSQLPYLVIAILGFGSLIFMVRRFAQGHGRGRYQ